MLDEVLNSSIGEIIGADTAFGHPSANVQEMADAYKVEVAAPGMEKEDFEIKIEKGHLHVRAEKKSGAEKHGEEESQERFTRREFNFQSFSRRFKLPEDVDHENVEASYTNGILKIEIKKSEQSTNVRVIEIE